VYSDSGVPIYGLDITLPELRYAAEYDGEEFHTEAEDREADEERRDWLGGERDWTIDAFTKREVYDRKPSPVEQLQAGFAQSRRKSRLWTPRRRD
jgi:hypothetical protein